MKPGGSNQKFHGEVFFKPPKGVGKMFRAPEIKNGLRFDYSKFFKLETCKNLFKFFFCKINSNDGPHLSAGLTL